MKEMFAGGEEEPIQKRLKTNEIKKGEQKTATSVLLETPGVKTKPWRIFGWTRKKEGCRGPSAKVGRWKERYVGKGKKEMTQGKKKTR